MSKGAFRTRRKKVVSEVKPPPKEKFINGECKIFNEAVQPALPKFQPANKRQAEGLSLLQTGCSVVFLTGSAGTGKSLLATYHAANLLKQKKIDKVYLVRPAVPTGKSVGLLKGDLAEKLEPYFAQTIAHFKGHMGNGFTDFCLRTGVIEYKAVEYLRGTSFERCVVIFEESQGFTHEEYEMLLTRLGKDCTFIYTGDEKQHDLRGTSGMTSTLEMLNKAMKESPDYLEDEDLANLDNLIGVVRFMPEDVVRSGLTRAFVKMYYHQ